VKDVGFIVKYSSEQRLISFSENVSDRGNARTRSTGFLYDFLGRTVMI